MIISKSYTRSDESHDLKTDLLQVTLAMMTHVRNQRQTDRIRSSRIIKLVNHETEHFCTEKPAQWLGEVAL